jgi:hypothetical protein
MTDRPGYPGKIEKINSPPRRCEKIGLRPIAVIPAEAGIQYFQALKKFLDPGLHRGDDKKAIFSHLPPSRGRD